jgi:hypothetical protein
MPKIGGINMKNYLKHVLRLSYLILPLTLTASLYFAISLKDVVFAVLIWLMSILTILIGAKIVNSKF